jgi:hypothetical protein
LIEVYTGLANTGKIPKSPTEVTGTEEQVKLKVFPFSSGDQYGPLKAYTAELWLEPGKKVQGDPATRPCV